MKSEAGILGYGEVGRAVAKFYKNPRIKDIERDDGLEGVDVLHICIPWSEKFIDVAVREIQAAAPRYTIIHSTVAPGTTRKIIEQLPTKLQGVVHSPVRGIHPNLYKGLKTFVKYIGAEDGKIGNAAKRHMERLGMRCTVFAPAVTTELGKLLSTTYYGVAIAWHGEMERMCKRFGADFDKAVSDFTRTYNTGYTKLGKANVVRPVLYPPQRGIGGHCVIENCDILRQVMESTALDLVLEYRPKKKYA